MLFKCHWYDTNPDKVNSLIQDMYLLPVNTNTRWFDEDPYILANTAKQVFCMYDPKARGGWKVVQFILHINIWNLSNT